MKQFKFLLLLLAATIIGLPSCGDDDSGPGDVTVLSIEAVGTSFEDGSAVAKDLNGSASATDVALNSTITITFDKDVDAATVNATNVALSSASGTEAATVTAAASSVTLKPNAELLRGTQYTLAISGVKASDGGTLTAVSRTFTTEGRAPVVVPNESSMIAYWPFDGAADDATGDYPADAVVDIEFGSDRFGQGSSTATFNGTTSIIEVLQGSRLMASNDFTISFWVKTNSTDHLDGNGNPKGNFVFGLGAFFGFQFEIPGDFGSCKLAMSYEQADGVKTGEDLWFNGSGEDGMNGGWQGWDFVADLTGTGGVEALLKDKWTHVVCTYNATTKKGQMFINGELMKSQDFNLWPDGDPKQTITGVAYRGVAPEVEDILAFGFIKSIDSELWAAEPWGAYSSTVANHFKGDLDDVRVFNAPFSGVDAKALYDAEKP